MTGINTKDFVKLVLGKTRILLPASELICINQTDNAGLSNNKNDPYIQIKINDIYVPVFAFNDNLQPIPVAESKKKSCVCLKHGKKYICILCDDAAIISLDDLKLHQVPPCMLTADTAVIAVAESNNNLYCISQTKNLVFILKNQPRD